MEKTGDEAPCQANSVLFSLQHDLESHLSRGEIHERQVQAAWERVLAELANAARAVVNMETKTSQPQGVEGLRNLEFDEEDSPSGCHLGCTPLHPPVLHEMKTNVEAD